MTKFLSFLLSAVILLSLCAVCVNATDSISLGIYPDSEIVLGEDFNINIKINNLPKALSALEFRLSFASSAVTPLVTDNSEGGMDAFMKVNNCSWIQLCRYDAENSCYYLRFCTPIVGTSGATPLTSAGDLLISIPFHSDTEQLIDFSIKSSDILAFDADMNVLNALNCNYSASPVNRDASYRTELIIDATPQNAVAYLTVNLLNTKVDGGIVAFEFDLYYDVSLVYPIVLSNENSEMDSFLVSTPGSGWEQMCYLYKDKGYYRVRLLSPNAGTAKEDRLMPGDTLTLCIPFAVTTEAGSSARFYINSEHCIGTDTSPKTIRGSGSVTHLNVTEIALEEFTGENIRARDGFLYGIPEMTDVYDITGILGEGAKVYYGGNVVSEGYIATGMTVRLYIGDEPVNSAIVIIKGDIDRNGEVDAADYLIAKRAFIGTVKLDTAPSIAARVSGGSEVTPLDFYMIKRHVLGTYTFK